MKVHEFFKNIHYLSDDELKLFEKFLLSPYYNTLQSTCKVYQIIRKNMVCISHENYEELKSIIINETNFSKATVRKILSFLNEMYIKYVKIQAYSSNKFQSEYVCCNYLLLKGNYNLLSKSVQRIDNLIFETGGIDEDSFLKMFEINILNYNILATSEDYLNPISKLEKQKEFTTESSRNLIVHTLSKATINYVNYVIQCNDSKNSGNSAYPINLHKLFNVISTHEFDSYNKLQKSTINLFHKIYKLYSNTLKDNYYDDYKNYFNEIKDLYNIEFHKTQISILLGFCLLRQRTNDKSMFYSSEGLSILFDYIEKEFYKNENTEYLHPLMYRNYVKNCMNLDRKDILLKFIDTHSEKLHPLEIEVMKKFGMAHYKYLAKDYKGSLAKSEFMVLPRFLYKYDIYSLIIKNCFELNYYDRIENILHNYNEYIANDSFLSRYDKVRHNYFVHCMRKFLIAYYKYETKHNIFDFEYLLKTITAKPNFIMKKWITQKVTTFISNHYNMEKSGNKEE